jgi:hypothetical protein
MESNYILRKKLLVTRMRNHSHQHAALDTRSIPSTNDRDTTQVRELKDGEQLPGSVSHCSGFRGREQQKTNEDE